MDPKLQQILGAMQSRLAAAERAAPPRDALAYINSIPGRRLFYMLVGTQLFDTDQDSATGVRGAPIAMLVNQDGPFIQTHYPIAMWKPSLPSNATDLGRWRPVYSWPLSDQVIDDDIVDISYEIIDAGSQRNFQNLPMPPLLSRPDALLKLPIPTLFAPNTVVQFIPTYHNVLFSTAPAVDTTEGMLVVGLPGYRVVNL